MSGAHLLELRETHWRTTALLGAVLLVAPAPVRAVETKVLVRVVAGDAKLLGDVVGGSVYAGEIHSPGPGVYTLEVLAADPVTGNYGLSRREVVLESPAEWSDGLGRPDPKPEPPR